jgi:3-hydroxyacyl-[acyl-carrier-protein] dehydratase
MKQNGILYDILEESECGFLLRMRNEHPVYQGHFPGNPITPGVLTLQMVRECLSHLIGRELRYSAIKNCRFVAMVRPGDTLRLALQSENVDGAVKLKASLCGSSNPEDMRLQLDADLQ